MALAALTSQQISRIVLVRPAVEAGESLGFSFRTLQEKLGSYIGPLYDALFDMTSWSMQITLLTGIVEIFALCGRTMNEVVI